MEGAGRVSLGRRCIAFAGLFASTARQQNPQALDYPCGLGKQPVISVTVTPLRKKTNRNKVAEACPSRVPLAGQAHLVLDPTVNPSTQEACDDRPEPP